MINKINISKIISGIPFHHTVYDKRTMHPIREWLFGLLFFVIIVIAGALYAAYMFGTYRNISSGSSSLDLEAVTYNELLIGNALSAYRGRSNAFLALQAEIAATEKLQVPEGSEQGNASEDARMPNDENVLLSQ